VSGYRDRASWYAGLSAYWFATSLKWFILLLAVIPGQVQALVPGGEKSTYWGMVFAIGAAWAVIGPSLFGYISDRKGDRRTYIVLGTGLTLVALAILATASSIWQLALGYLVLQVADDLGTGAYSALVPQLVPEERRGRASGIMGLMQFLGQITIAVIAFVLKSDPTQLYIVVGVINVIGAAGVLLTLRGAGSLRPEDTGRESGVADYVRGWFSPWKSRDFVWVWFTRFLTALGFYLVQPYIKYFLDDVVKVFTLFGMTFEKSSLAVVVLALTLALFGGIASILGGKAADKVGRKKTIYIGGTVMAAAAIPFAMTSSYTTVWVLVIVFGIGYGLYQAADWALVADVLPDKASLGRDMGIWQMSISSVQIVTGVAGRGIDYFNAQTPGLGYRVAFFTAAVVLFLGTVLVRQVKGST
jgi:MFS family permease